MKLFLQNKGLFVAYCAFLLHAIQVFVGKMKIPIIVLHALKFTGSRNKNDKCMFLLYIEANSVSNSKGQKTKTSEDGCKHGALMEFSLKDLYAIQEIQAEENLFKLIVKYV